MNLEISSITPTEIELLYEFLSKQPFSYRKDFHPFQEESIDFLESLITYSTKDRYYMVTLNGMFAAFFMLRGWQEGFERPSFGLLVDHQHANKGLGKLCMQAALIECRILGIKEIMLKVSPSNTFAMKIYTNEGFKFNSCCKNTGHFMLVKQLL